MFQFKTSKKLGKSGDLISTSFILFKINHQQVKLMWTPEALSLFMRNHPYLDSVNDVEIHNALKDYSRL